MSGRAERNTLTRRDGYRGEWLGCYSEDIVQADCTSSGKTVIQRSLTILTCSTAEAGRRSRLAEEGIAGAAQILTARGIDIPDVLGVWNHEAD